MQRWLADSAARIFDGVPLFPQPLTALSATWIGSPDVESTLSRALRAAMDRFGGFVRDQGKAVEEFVTGNLLNELEGAFRTMSLRLETGGRGSAARAIGVQQRPVQKSVEEPVWGCDVALLLTVDLRPSVRLDVAELVQIKKSQAFMDRPSASLTERWRIDVQQLLTILERSESAVYWLIFSTGEVACVTARWIHGVARGQDALRQGSFTVGYSEVRHADVPMEQFLPELFMGTWLGTCRDSTLTFARGEEVGIKPRHIFEILVSSERQG